VAHCNERRQIVEIAAHAIFFLRLHARKLVSAYLSTYTPHALKADSAGIR
jgi:hypothetical protein